MKKSAFNKAPRSRQPARALLLFYAALWLAFAAACNRSEEPSPAAETPPEAAFGSPENWAIVFFHTDLTVALDTTRMEPMPDGSYLLWFQKIWVTPRKAESRPFNRELIHALVRCKPLAFKTVSVTLFYDEGPPVAEAGGSVSEATKKEWKTPTPGSADEGGFQQACMNLGGLVQGKK